MRLCSFRYWLSDRIHDNNIGKISRREISTRDLLDFPNMEYRTLARRAIYRMAVQDTSSNMSSSKNGLKGTSNPGELFANCFIVIILQILSWNSECSTIFVLQIGQTILGFKRRWLYLSINKVIRILRISFLCTSRPIPNHKMKQTSLKYTSLLSKSIK